VNFLVNNFQSFKVQKKHNSKRLDYSKLVEECTKNTSTNAEKMDYQETRTADNKFNSDNSEKRSQNTIIHQLQTKFSRFVKFILINRQKLINARNRVPHA